MRSRRKGWGWVLVLGAVSIGGLWSAGDPWTSRCASGGDGAAGRVADPLEPHRHHQ